MWQALTRSHASPIASRFLLRCHGWVWRPARPSMVKTTAPVWAPQRLIRKREFSKQLAEG
jgi:hypothetical protein